MNFLIFIIMLQLSSAAYAENKDPTNLDTKPTVPAPKAAEVATPTPTTATPNETELNDSEYKIQIVRPKSASEQIPELSWQSSETELEVQKGKTGIKLLTRLNGTFRSENGVLAFGENSISLEEKTGQFSLEVPLVGEITTVALYAISATGEVKTENFLLRIRAWPQLQTRLKNERDAEQLLSLPETKMHIGLGYNSLNYKELGVQPFSENALSVLLSYENSLGLITPRLNHFKWMAAGRATLFPLNANRDASMKLLQFNTNVGYELLRNSPRWGLTTALGGYYRTTIVSAPSSRQVFGFQDLMGPDFQVQGTFRPRPFEQISLVLKFAAMSDGSRLLGFENREFTTGLSYQRNYRGHVVSLGLEVSSLKFQLNANGDSKIELDTKTLSLGISW